jgi:hypothetical protein
MSNREVEFILKMRDDATGTWNRVKNEINAGSKQIAETMKGNLLGLGASIAALAFSLKMAFDLAEAGAKLEQARQVFNQTVNKMGMDATAVFENIREKSGGMVDDEAILRSSNRAAAMGVPIKDLGDLMLLARDRARNMGLTTQEAFERITEGIGRGSQRMLKMVGIQVDLKGAMKEYANEMNLATGETISHGAQLAMLNQIQETYIKNLDETNLQLLTNAERMQKIRASVADMKEFLGTIALRIGLFFAGTVTSIGMLFQAGATGLFGLMSLVEMGLNKIGVQNSSYFQDLTKKSSDTYNKMGKDAEDYFKAVFAASKDLAAPEDKTESIDNTSKALEQLQGSVKKLREEYAMLSSKEGRELQKETDELANKITNLKETIKREMLGLHLESNIDFAINMKMTFNQEQIAQEMEAMKSHMKSQGGHAFSFKPEFMSDADWSAQNQKYDDQLGVIKELKKRRNKESIEDEKQIVQQWMAQSIIMAHDNQDLIKRIRETGTREIVAIELQETQRVYQQVGEIASRALQLLSQAESQASQAKIQAIEKEYLKFVKQSDKEKTAELKSIETTKNAKILAIDTQLQKDNLSTEQRKVLETQKFDLENKYSSQRDLIEEKYTKAKEKREEEYNEKVSKAKAEEFETTKTISILEAIINTAVAVTKALPNLPLAIAVGILGAVEVGIIASQSAPAFHEGGVVKGDDPNREVVARLLPGETVRTRSQELAIKSMFNTLSVNSSPDEQQEMLRQTIQELHTVISDLIVHNQTSTVSNAGSITNNSFQVQMPQISSPVSQAILSGTERFSQSKVEDNSVFESFSKSVSGLNSEIKTLNERTISTSESQVDKSLASKEVSSQMIDRSILLQSQVSNSESSSRELGSILNEVRTLNDHSTRQLTQQSDLQKFSKDSVKETTSKVQDFSQIESSEKELRSIHLEIRAMNERNVQASSSEIEKTRFNREMSSTTVDKSGTLSSTLEMSERELSMIHSEMKTLNEKYSTSVSSQVEFFRFNRESATNNQSSSIYRQIQTPSPANKSDGSWTENKSIDNSVHNHFQFTFSGSTSEISKADIKRSVQEGMRELGVEDVTDYFKNNRAKVTSL